MNSSGYTVRPYHPPDREALLEIAADTAYFGAPVEAVLEDRRVLLAAFYNYYPDHEPELAWVACAGEEVAGFLVGCRDTRRQERIWRGMITRTALKAVLGRFRLGPKTVRFTGRRLRAVLRGEVPQPDLARYPAHLHLNVAAEWRGQGLGRRLLSVYLDQLRALGVAGVHLHTTSRNIAACRLYEKLGFTRLVERRTQIWGEGVSNRLYGLQL